MKHRKLLTVLSIWTAIVNVTAPMASNAAPATQSDKLSCRSEVPADFIATHPIDMCWKHPGGNKAFTNRSAAMAGRAGIFRQFKLGTEPGFVEAAIAATDKAPTRRMMIVRRNWFDDMAEGGGVVRHNVLADFLTPLEGMASSVANAVSGLFLWADEWEFTFHGKLVKIFLPDICFNWADRIKDAPVAPPAPPPAAPPQEDCVEVGHMVKAGSLTLSGVSGDEASLHSWCTAQRMPGETTWKHSFEIEDCAGSCNLQRVADDLGETIIPGYTEVFRAKVSGIYTRRYPRSFFVKGNHGKGGHEFDCQELLDKHQSWGEYVTKEQFDLVQGHAFIEYRREDAPAAWVANGGKALEWRFKPFAGEKNTQR